MNKKVDIFMSKEIPLLFLAHSNRIAVYKQSDLSTENCILMLVLTVALICNAMEVYLAVCSSGLIRIPYL
jgi:hypothetical protein